MPGQAQHDVLENAHAGDEGEFLLDEAHAEVARATRRRDRDGSTFEEEIATIRLRQTGKDADQRRPSGAVRRDEAVHLPGQTRDDTPLSAWAPP